MGGWDRRVHSCFRGPLLHKGSHCAVYHLATWWNWMLKQNKKNCQLEFIFLKLSYVIDNEQSIPVCTLSPVLSWDILTDFPFSSFTFDLEGKQLLPPPLRAGVVVVVVVGVGNVIGGPVYMTGTVVLCGSSGPQKQHPSVSVPGQLV